MFDNEWRAVGAAITFQNVSGENMLSLFEKDMYRWEKRTDERVHELESELCHMLYAVSIYSRRAARACWDMRGCAEDITTRPNKLQFGMYYTFRTSVSHNSLKTSHMFLMLIYLG